MGVFFGKRPLSKRVRLGRRAPAVGPLLGPNPCQ
jgi:hypothetical protein